MNDERFEHELKSVLREIAGREAPMSLRTRVADVIDQAPLGRRLWFAPPLKLSLVAIGAVAVLALAVLFVGPLMVGPTPSQTPEPSASASASSIEPTPSAQPSATLEPTPILTPEVAVWTGLNWTKGTVEAGSSWVINDVVAWGDGYVGVGTSRHGDHEAGTQTTSAAFFTSADGLHWALVQEGDPINEDMTSQSEEWFPLRIVPVGDTLLAVGHLAWGPSAPRLWSSEDGSTWTLLDNPSWRDALTNNTLISVASGPTGIVVVASEGSGFRPQGLPLIIHSSDGVTWDRLDLSAVFDRAYFWDVTAYTGGFAIVGRIGEPNVLAADESARGVPAAWTSADGVTWLAAEVEGSEAPGAALLTVVAGADGLFATGYPTEWTSWQSPRSGWASTDGRSWQLVGQAGTDLPLATDLGLAVDYPTSVVGDGAHMVMFGRESCKTTELLAWTSLDGVTWTELTFSGETSFLPIVPGPICNDDGTEGAIVGAISLSNAVVTPDGVFAMTTTSAPIPPGLWFLRATTQ
jgi:hypothetical protein